MLKVLFNTKLLFGLKKCNQLVKWKWFTWQPEWRLKATKTTSFFATVRHIIHTHTHDSNAWPSEIECWLKVHLNYQLKAKEKKNISNIFLKTLLRNFPGFANWCISGSEFPVQSLIKYVKIDDKIQQNYRETLWKILLLLIFLQFQPEVPPKSKGFPEGTQRSGNCHLWPDKKSKIILEILHLVAISDCLLLYFFQLTNADSIWSAVSSETQSKEQWNIAGHINWSELKQSAMFLIILFIQAELWY